MASWSDYWSKHLGEGEKPQMGTALSHAQYLRQRELHSPRSRQSRRSFKSWCRGRAARRGLLGQVLVVLSCKCFCHWTSAVMANIHSLRALWRATKITSLYKLSSATYWMASRRVCAMSISGLVRLRLTAFWYLNEDEKKDRLAGLKERLRLDQYQKCEKELAEAAWRVADFPALNMNIRKTRPRNLIFAEQKIINDLEVIINNRMQSWMNDIHMG